MSKKKDNDLFGKNIMVGGDSIISKKKMVISLGPALDIIMGGIQEGTYGVATGPPKVGKTMFCLHAAACAQKKEYNYICPKTKKSIPRKVYYANIEGRLNGRDLAGIKGLITTADRFQVIGSNLDRILDGAEYLEIIESLIKSEPGAIFILDSLSQLCTKERMETKIRDRHRDVTPLLISAFGKKICNIVPVTNSIVMAITHIISNQGGTGMSPWYEASGRKLQYNCDFKLKLLYKKYYPLDAEIPKGQLIEFLCETSNLGPPGQKIKSLLRYGLGFDMYYDLAVMCSEIGVITKGGSWYTLPDETKHQGLEKLSQHIRDNKDIYDSLLKEFKDLVG